MNELEEIEVLKELYEFSKKKNKKLQKTLNLESFAGKLKLICFIFSFMTNNELDMKCNS